MCDFQYSGCTYTFYLSETKTSEVLISDDINCPLGALPWIIAGSLVGAILLLGLLALILLKLLFMFLVCCVLCVCVCVCHHISFRSSSRRIELSTESSPKNFNKQILLQ